MITDTNTPIATSELPAPAAPEVTPAEVDAEAAKAKEEAKVGNVYVLDGLLPMARLNSLEDANSFAAKLKQGEFYASPSIIAQLLNENKIRLVRGALRVLTKAPDTSADDIFQAAADAVKAHLDLKRRQADVAVAAQLLWDELEAFSFAPVSKPPVKEKKTAAPKAPKDPNAPRKPGYMDYIRAAFPEVGSTKTLAELLGGASYSESTIKVGVTDLRNPNYSKGPTMNIKMEPRANKNAPIVYKRHEDLV